MNRSFELGIDYKIRKSGIAPLNTKQFLNYVATQYDYIKALSDINGFDQKAHHNDSEGVLKCLYA